MNLYIPFPYSKGLHNKHGLCTFKHTFVHTPCTIKQEFEHTLCTFKHFRMFPLGTSHYVWYWCVIKNFILHISLNFIFLFMSQKTVLTFTVQGKISLLLSFTGKESFDKNLFCLFIRGNCSKCSLQLLSRLELCNSSFLFHFATTQLIQPN